MTRNESVDMFLKKWTQKYALEKKLLAKNALKQANFIVFSSTFQE